ncbi:hypothetical protein K435DRAFT_935432 [Dendrothele bispora CBS 962.96]|uniref:RING-type domain-containing protein n=1 Tax=Dendrothele bispora (strain CBS 962.96) TaxID=1314807 RepID=A0A4S8L0H4_DENBC|nr:hypothetical protein K435DRAFT_935432 [Dendrothele bispora CBS 962.96]
MDFEPLGFHSYCAICDDYFQDHFTRARHVENSPNHPKCSLCGCRFLNKNLLRNHKIMAPHHHYCRTCDKDFHSSGGLQVHIDTIHLDDDSDEDMDDEDYERREREHPLKEGWEDERALELYPDGNYDDSYKEDILKDVEERFHNWEFDDEFDFEDPEDLEDGPFEFGREADTEEDDEYFYGWEGDEVVKLEVTDKFTCPMCLEEDPKTVCTTTCGHLFCAQCIVGALKYTETCPVCDEYGEVCGLRRVYVSDNH